MSDSQLFKRVVAYNWNELQPWGNRAGEIKNKENKKENTLLGLALIAL